MRFILYVPFLMFFINGNAQTEDKDKVTIEGFIEADNISYKNELDKKVNARRQIISNLKLSSTINDSKSFSSLIEFREDVADKDRNRVNIKEAYFVTNFSSSDLIIGKQVIHWGTVDAFNPTNNINSIDYSDLLDTDDERIGVMAINYKYYLNNWSFQALAYTFTPSIMPNYQSRWAIVPSPKISNGAGGMLNAAYFYKMNTPDYTLKNTQLGFKTNRSISGWDFSVSYLSCFYDLPEVASTVSPVSADSVNIMLQQGYFKRQIVGFDLASSLGKMGFRFETALNIPEKKSTYKESYVQYVLGLDRSFSLGDANSISFIGQWIDEISVKGKRYPTADLEHLFQKVIMLRTELALVNKFKISLSSFALMQDKGYYFQPKFEYSVADGVEITFLADILGGENGSLFKLFDDNDRLQLKFKYYF